MYIVTGGAGFIGSAMVWQLNQLGITDILVVDHLATSEKWKNLVPLKYRDYIDRDEFASKIRNRSIGHIDAIIHLGACSATTERDADYLMDNNAKWTVELATWAVERESRFIYASSAATYGDGAQGFDDDQSPEALDKLAPLNLYGWSKHQFDKWAVERAAEELTEALNEVRPFRRLEGIDLKSYAFGSVFVDPPRAGMDPDTCELTRRFERILYISCNPETLAANIAQLHDTHRISRCALFDQFPFTHHMESGVLLERR